MNSNDPHGPTSREDGLAPYLPSVYYFRKALHGVETVDEAVAVGLHLCRELEQLKAWVREQGMVPPKWHIMPDEIAEKGWGEIVAFPSSE